MRFPEPLKRFQAFRGCFTDILRAFSDLVANLLRAHRESSIGALWTLFERFQALFSHFYAVSSTFQTLFKHFSDTFQTRSERTQNAL